MNKRKIKKKLLFLTIILISLVFILANIAYNITFGDQILEFAGDQDFLSSRVEGNVVYVNELENDYNYYMGLNYTTNNGQLPTTDNKNIYNDTNLVQTKIKYLGTDLANNIGYVSQTERQNTYIYFNTYYVNDNNTPDNMEDDFIEIILIDNPFTDRPNDLAFNGWICDTPGVYLLFDSVYYERKAKIPIEYENGKPKKIDLIFRVNWIDAKVEYVTNNLNNAIQGLNISGLKKIERYIYEYGEFDMTGYFRKVTIGFFQSYAGYYNEYGQYQTGGRCTSFTGCIYYDRIENEIFNENEEYYELVNNQMTLLDNSTIQIPIISQTENEILSELLENKNMSSFYKKVTIPRYNSYAGYYNENGEYQETGTCNTNGGCTFYELLQYYKDDNTENIYNETDEFYYLVTRDTNILVIRNNISGAWTNQGNRPFTITSHHNGNNYNATWNVNNPVIAYDDLNIENVRIYNTNSLNADYKPPQSTSAGVLYGNYNNVRIGRGLTRNNNYYSFLSLIAGNNGATGSNNNPQRYRFQVESGFYHAISLVAGASTGSSSLTPNYYIKNKSVYGNDYDKAKNDNSKLEIYYCASGSWGGKIYASTNSSITNDVIFDLTVKSGKYGTNKYDNTTGIYIGGRNGGTQYSVRQIKIEGGYIYNLIGGPISANNRTNLNDIYIYMTGGEVDMITAGAGQSATYGNRIVQITGGKVNYSVFGGSNGYDGYEGDGTLNGSSYIYIGGNSLIGDETLVNNNNKLYGAEAGSVFGIGNGKSGSSTIGSNDNSTIIIDGNAVIRNNVYGGGNFGATGISSSSNTSTTTIIINDGLIYGSVYGGGNNNGSGSNSKNSNIKITMNNGNVVGSIYGGSNEQGIIYGNVEINMNGGEIANSIYGGGRGGINNLNNGTFVKENINITIGDDDHTNIPIINDGVYGGSAFGTVGGTENNTNISQYKTNIIVNEGLITNVFGGGQGDATFVPYVLGDIKVTINDGIINNVFGGNDISGTPNGKVEVFINGGTIDNTFGGGNQTSVNETNVYLNAGNVNKIFGGSNQSGNVNISNIITTGGICNSVYGGNNLGGQTNTTNVLIDGGEINNVYGGGDQTSIGNKTNIEVRSRVENVFGGSNKTGNVPQTDILINNGVVTNVYGGNNEGGTTETTKIDYRGIYSENVYGGGKNAFTTTTNINAYQGVIKNLYGGGNQAGANETNINLGNTVIKNAFGGSNMSGNIPNSYIENLVGLSAGKVELDITYQQSDQHNSQSPDYQSSQKINVSIKNNGSQTISNWDLYIITSEGFIGANWSSATIENKEYGYHVNQINQYYGTNTISPGNYFNFDFHIHSMVPYEEFEILGYYFIGYDSSNNTYTNNMNVDRLHGGNNQGGMTTSTNINLTSGNINYLYGGGKNAPTNHSDIIINNTNINNAIFGGGDQAPIENTNMIIENSIVGTETENGYVYGGGNAASANNTTTIITNNTVVNGIIFGGGNEGPINGISNLTINGNTRVSGTVYGGGNLAEVMNKSVTIIENATISNNIYGAGNRASVGNGNETVVELTINNTSAKEIYGGGNAAATNGNIHTNISNSNITNAIFGGGNGIESIVPGDATGELNYAKVIGDIQLNISNNTITKNIYGGGNLGKVTGNTHVYAKNIETQESIYGGGNAAIVENNTNLKVSNSTINDSIYAGGNGQTAQVKGNTNLDIENNTNIINHVFGGGNAAPTGTQETNSSHGIVNIAGATIGKNVYGGANTSVLYGTTTLNIGKNSVSNPDLVTSNIQIGGTVFGGGEANASGSEIYDYSFISITEGININIDASEHELFVINGSIFGSGNASSTQGYSNINIKNYGTQSDIKRNISIQRADQVTLDNSYIELAGAKDRTNEYSEVLFTLSRIKELKLKNSSSIYLKKGANLLEKVNSVVDINGTETKAVVTIDNETNTFNRNTNNRIYILEGENLNIARNQNVTEYGDVLGMTFFGMYLLDRNNNIITALYDDYNNGQSVSSGDIYFFTNGSYVLGRHYPNHDITKDGFYSNYGNEEGNAINIKYIEPTPPDSQFYIWSIGEVVASYDVTLTASKYSTLGAQEIPLINHANPNTVFSVLGVNFSGLDPSIHLVEYNEIPRVANTEEDANTKFGLNMKSGESGWLVNGNTNFITEGDINVIGTKEYIRENLNNTPAFVFYLYHSKNLTTSGNMGSVTISLMAITPIDDLNNDVERININIDLNRALYNTNDYEGTITPGKKYEMFATSSVDITTKSSFSTYYSLFIDSETSPYQQGYHRSLVSTYALPINTKITMIDLHNQSNPIYYYYVINSEDYQDSLIEYNRYGEASYNLSKFIKMGSVNPDNNYDDEYYNSIYYNNNVAEEEFIFIVDFKDTTIDTNVLNKTLLIELRNDENQTLISVLGIEQSTLKYNLYQNSDAYINAEGTISKNPVYLGNNTTFIIDTNFEQQTLQSITINDTTYENEKLGIKISIYDSHDNLLSAQDLLGISFNYKNETYYPSYNGTTRIKIAEKVGSARSRITFNTGTSNLATGTYYFLIEAFGSYDGIYYGNKETEKITIPLNIISSPYGLKITTADDDFVFLDKNTGFNLKDNQNYVYKINYISELANAELRIKLQRRNYDSIYNNIYEDVNLLDYVSDTLNTTNHPNEYFLVDNPVNDLIYTLHFKENLMTGTYRLVISLYDNDNYIGEVYKYIIIR